MKTLNQPRPMTSYESNLPRLAAYIVKNSGVADPTGEKHRTVLMILRAMFEQGETLEIGYLPY